MMNQEPIDIREYGINPESLGAVLGQVPWYALDLPRKKKGPNNNRSDWWSNVSSEINRIDTDGRGTTRIVQGTDDPDDLEKMFGWSSETKNPHIDLPGMWSFYPR